MLEIDTKPLLRPAQVEEFHSEKKSLETKLHSPYTQDKGEVARQLRDMERIGSKQIPHPFKGGEKDEAIKMEADLRERITRGMPSHEEMRKNPAGAVDKHMAWEKRNKKDVQRWKNLQLRINAGNSDGSVANLEKYRPSRGTLNMDGAQIQGTSVFLPPEGAGLPVTFSEAQLAFLREINPELSSKLALLDNEARAKIKGAMDIELKKAALMQKAA